MLPNKHGAILISGGLNGEAAKFVLDTGAFWGILRRSAANTLPVKMAPLSGVGAGGGTINSYVTVPSFQLGEIKLPKADFFIGPDLSGEEGLVSGNIGMAMLKGFDVEIDPGRGRFKLFLPNKCEVPPIYWNQSDVVKLPFDFNNDQITIQVLLNGKPVRAFLDTGASVSFLSSSAAEAKLGITKETEGVEESQGASTLDGVTLENYRFRFESLVLGDITFKNTWLTISEDKVKAVVRGARDRMYPDLVLGMHQLRNLHLYIDFKKKVIYVSTVSGDALAEKNQGNEDYKVSNIISSSIDYEIAAPYIESAEKYVKDGLYDKALEEISRAIKTLPANEQLIFFRGRIHSYLKNYSDALVDYENALKIDPDLIEVKQARAETYVAMGDYTNAISDLSYVIANNPQEAFALKGRCWLYAKQKSFEAAISDCKSASTLNPQDADVWRSLGFLHLEKQAYDLAIKDFSEVLKLAPESPDVLYARGFAREKIGDSRAGEDKKAAALLDPNIAKRVKR